MNPQQMAQQIKHELGKVAWLTGSTEVVFGSTGAVVFAGTPTEAQIPPRMPWVLVGIGSGEPDGDHPELITQTFQVITGAEVSGDPMGEFTLIGGAAADLGKSTGRGITELGARVRAAVGNLTGADGAKILLTGTGIDTPTKLGGSMVVVDEHTFTALCTSDLDYTAPQKIASSGNNWTWAGGDLNGAGHCSGRFDFKDYQVTTTTGGNIPVYNVNVVATSTTASATFTTASGQVYGVFARYSARKQSGVVEGNSDPVIGSYLTAP